MSRVGRRNERRRRNPVRRERRHDHPIGTRVGALSHYDAEFVYLYGWGVYEGEFVPEQACGDIGEYLREYGDQNPRIRLDDGKIVYGCECWWGPEEEIRTKFAGRQFVDVDIDRVRQACRGSGPEADPEPGHETTGDSPKKGA
jgi:hypothetical protein